MADDVKSRSEMPTYEQQLERLEMMRSEIGEILERLKEKNVYDLKEKIPVILINRGSINPEFKRTEILKVKNFVTIVNQSLDGFS